MLNNYLLGTKTEYECAAKFLELGCMVSIPVSHFAVYDLIVDLGIDKLFKVQCKTSNGTSDSFSFGCTTTRINTKGAKVHSYSDSEIDLFATTFDNKLYIVPIDECNACKTLRLEIPANLQTTHINWAVNYEADYMIAKLRGNNVRPRVDMDSILMSAKIKLNPELNPDYQYKYRWITNGKINKKFIGNTEQIPEGFVIGRT